MRLGRRQERSANALPAVLRNNRQVVDVEEWARLERGESKETHGNANGSLIGERE